MSEWKDKMFAKLAEQKVEFINAHINTYGEYPKCYMSDLDIETIFAIRRVLEARIVKLHDQKEKAVRDHVFLKGQQVSLMDFLEHLDEFVQQLKQKEEKQND